MQNTQLSRRVLEQKYGVFQTQGQGTEDSVQLNSQHPAEEAVPVKDRSIAFKCNFMLKGERLNVFPLILVTR